MTSGLYGPLTNCMNCGETGLTSVLFLGYLAPVSTMSAQSFGPEKGTRYPTEILYCPSCHLVQLGYVPNPKELFQPDYTYTSGTTRSIRENFTDLFHKACDHFDLKTDDLIVDIGSNDGTLLSNFKEGGYRVVGIEPTNIADFAAEKGITTIKSFLSLDAVSQINDTHGKARLVTAANVFAHIPNLDNVMSCIRGLLKDDGGYNRHPLTFLVEAADDICYTIIDFEDGINLGLVQEDYALEYLINLVRDSINTEKYNALNNTIDRVSYLRALSINTLINEAVQIFIENEDDILSGNFHVSLLKKSKYKPQISDIIKISVEKIYESKEVIEKEVAGYNIINKLLDTFISSVNRYYEGNQTSYDDLILKLLPSTTNLNHDNLYSRLLEICHYVASLSDRKALNVYNKITGVEYQ